MGDARYTDDDIQRLGMVIAEDIKSEFRTGFEAIDEIKNQVAKIPAMQEDITELKDDMRAVKAAIKAIGQTVRRHEQHINKLGMLLRTVSEKTDQIIEGMIPEIEKTTAQRIRLDDHDTKFALHDLRLKVLEKAT